MPKILGRIVMVVVMALALSAGAVHAEDGNYWDVLDGEVYHLDLFQKGEDWEVIVDGAYGRFAYNTTEFVFNGFALQEGGNYTLIRFEDEAAENTENVVCLTSGTATTDDTLHLDGALLDGGAKIWLVLSADVDCAGGEMTGWNPSEYLFESALIGGGSSGEPNETPVDPYEIIHTDHTEYPGYEHFHLYEKDANWVAVPGGNEGHFHYDADDFIFDANMETNYTLIRMHTHLSPSVTCLASGATDATGDIDLTGAMQEGGAKVWLVLSADVDCAGEEMIGWNPSEYLFENALLPQTDPVVPPIDNENINRIRLYKKDANWTPVDVANYFGVFHHDETNFTVTARVMLPNFSYTVIRSNGDINSGITCLATQTSNNQGELYMQGQITGEGEKIWVVKSNNVDCEAGSFVQYGWYPEYYLFENSLLQ